VEQIRKDYEAPAIVEMKVLEIELYSGESNPNTPPPASPFGP